MTGHEILTLRTGPVGWLALLDGRTALTSDDSALRVWDLASGKVHHAYALPDRGGDLYGRPYGQGLALSPDGQRAATSVGDGTLLVWDLTLARRAADGKPLAADELKVLWDGLASKDAAKAYRALWRLADVPEEAVRFLRQHVKPTVVEDPQKIRRLIAELDDDLFAVREAAQKALAKLDTLAEPVLREALNNNPSAETRRRIEGLLANSTLGAPDPETLRRLRAVQVLERVATPEARKVLQDLASGAAGDRLTREAKAALQRFHR
jgi:hypothetical protein